MKFMTMHKMTDEMEKGAPPTPEVMAGVGAMMQDAAKQGVFLSGEGLKPSSQRLRLVYKNGKRTLTEGPFKDAKELIAGFALLQVRSKDEALTWLDRFAAVVGDVEVMMGPVVEPWDLGFAPKPADAPLRYLCTHMATAESESDAPPPPAVMQKMQALVQDMTAAGVMQATGGLMSTRKGARIRFSGGKHTVIDGPFAESKELIAGYAMFELPSKEAAIEWAVRFGKVVAVNEVDIRQVAE